VNSTFLRLDSGQVRFINGLLFQKEIELMTRRRFYAAPNSFAGNGQSVRLAAEEARHLRDVLRLQPGAEVYVFDGAGKEFHCAIKESTREFAELEILAGVQPARPESPLDLTLAVALLKGEKFDLVVQKATELGVTRLLPIITERADVRVRDETDAHKRVARWQRIALEAAKQSGRARVPEVGAPLALDQLRNFPVLEHEGTLTAVNYLMFSERDGQSLSQVNRILSDRRDEKMVALVGPEGGWTDNEIRFARDASWHIVTLGGRTLRAETAAVTVVALLQHLLGDLV
jgi:16S rRNA (uracil1498-N3)-methyltransferase